MTSSHRSLRILLMLIGKPRTTKEIATRLETPTRTVLRLLESLEASGLRERRGEGRASVNALPDEARWRLLRGILPTFESPRKRERVLWILEKILSGEDLKWTEAKDLGMVWTDDE